MFRSPIKFKIPRNNDINVNNDIIVNDIIVNNKKEFSDSPRWINNIGKALIDNKKIEENNYMTYFKVNIKKHNNFEIEKIEIPDDIKKSEKKNKENEVENKNIKLNNLRNKYKKILEDRKINKNKTDIKTAGDGKEINSKNKIGHFVMEKVELQIGGSNIDKKFGDWLDILKDLKSGKYDDGYDDIINNKILIDNTIDKINDNIIEYIQLDNLDKIYNYNNYNDTNIIEI